MEFSYDSDNPTHGILWHLYSNSRSFYNNLIFTNQTSRYGENYDAKYAIDFNDALYWHPGQNNPGEHITIMSFYYIKLKGYLVQTSNLGPSNCHPRSWYFASSNNGVNFVNKQLYDDVGDHMKNNLRYQYVPYRSKKSRYFRLYLNRAYCNSIYKSDINQVELFGTLYKRSEYPDKTCFCRSYSSSIITMLTLIVINK